MVEQKERKKENEIHVPEIKDIEHRSDVQTGKAPDSINQLSNGF